MEDRFYRRLMAAALAGASVAAMTLPEAPAVAQSSERRSFDIPAQGAADALEQFGRQSGRAIMFDPARLVGARSRAVRGMLTPDEALRRMLAGTGFRARRANANTYVIEATSDRAENGSGGPSEPAGQALPARGAGGESAEGAAATIVVTGSRLRRGQGDEGPAPVATFDRERIEELGVTNVADVLSYLSAQPFSINEQVNPGGAREIRLRGLGIGTTLILIDGRRTVTSAVQAVGNRFDVNTIPLAAVERIEVLSSSASAVYGADALAGVVNIVTRRSIDRPQIDLYYGGADGGATERRASFSVGHAGDRWNAALTLDYFDRDFLFGSERSFSSNQDFRRFGGLDRRSPIANPGNITSATAANLPGLNSRFAAVPAGSTGVGLTPASFVATAGQTNLESLNFYASVIPRSRRYSAAGAFDYELTDGLTFFVQGLYRRAEDERRGSPPSLSNRLVPASNAFNPFGVPVLVNFALTGYGGVTNGTDSDFYRGVAGITARMGRWDGEVSVLRIHETALGFDGNLLNTARVNAALASSDPAAALNPFQDGPGGSPALLASLLDPLRITRLQSDAIQAAFFLRGPLVDLPAGLLDIVVGAEARSEAIAVSTTVPVVAGSRATEAAYAEARIPLISPDMAVPLIRSLAVTLAGRHDNYSDFGGTTNPQVGAMWSPVRALLIRGSWGRSFKPPSLGQLFLSPSTAQGQIADPLRNNEVVPFTQFAGGNPNLEPERATSLTAGFLFTPPGPLNLRFGANWWRIRQELRIVNLSAPVFILNAALFPGRVVRQAPTPGDIAAGLPGRLVSVDITAINSGLLNTSGVDFEASGRLQTGFGAFSLSTNATWVDYFRLADFPGLTPVDRVGLATNSGSVPRWRVVSTLGWSQSGVNLALTTRWNSSYADATQANILNGRRVPGQALVDLDGSIDLARAWPGAGFTDGLVLRGGVKNLFDREPNYAEVGGTSGFDTSLTDVRQRFFYAGLSKRF